MVMITKIECNKERNLNKKIKVAAYARVSTDSDDQLLSLETQKEHYENYIKSNSDWEFAGLYFDEGISGTKIEKRDSLIKLISDCERGLIDRVITKSISRFSRNTVDCLELVRKLTSLGIYLYFEKENIDTEHMSSELMLSILSSIAESESRSISENSKWSVKRRFESGTYIISYPPYGYKNVNGKMVVVPEEVKVVKDIFKMALSGKGSHLIAKELNSRNILSRRNREWHSSSIQSILKNEKYTGDVILQKTYTDENYNRHLNYGEKDKYFIEGHHESIISHEDFNLVQDIISQRGNEKGVEIGTDKYLNRYAFTGKLICGECNSHLKRKKYFKSNSEVILWACKKHIEEKETCSMKSVEEKDIKLAFLHMVNKLVAGQHTVIKPFIEDLKGVQNHSNVKDVITIDNELNNLKDQQETLMKIYSNGYLDRGAFNKESIELNNKTNELEKEKIRISKLINDDATYLKEAQKLLKLIQKTPKIEEFDDKLFTEIVEKLFVIDRHKFRFQLKSGLNFIEEVD